MCLSSTLNHLVLTRLAGLHSAYLRARIDVEGT